MSEHTKTVTDDALGELPKEILTEKMIEALG